VKLRLPAGAQASLQGGTDRRRGCWFCARRCCVPHSGRRRRGSPRAGRGAWSGELRNGTLVTIAWNEEAVKVNCGDRANPLHLAIPSTISGEPAFATGENVLVVALPCGKSALKVLIEQDGLGIADLQERTYAQLDSDLELLIDGGAFGASASGTMYRLDEQRALAEEIFDRGSVAAPAPSGFLSNRLFGSEKHVRRHPIVAAEASAIGSRQLACFLSASGNVSVWCRDVETARFEKSLGSAVSPSHRAKVVALDANGFVIGYHTADTAKLRVLFLLMQEDNLIVQEKSIPAQYRNQRLMGIKQMLNSDILVIFEDAFVLSASTAREQLNATKVWTFEDELSEKGCWSKTDGEVATIEDRVFAPGRFTNAAIAAAVQRSPSDVATRKSLLKIVTDFVREQRERDPERSEKDIIDQVIRRATKAMLAFEMEILGVGQSSSGLPLLVRKAGSTILRPCLPDEINALFPGEELSAFTGIALAQVNGSWAWDLAASSALQIAASSRTEYREAIPILRRPSEADAEVGLAHVASRYVQQNLLKQGDSLSDWTFELCLGQILSTMVPSSLLLRFLCAIREYNTLAEAAARLSAKLPAAAHLSAGISAVASYSKRFPLPLVGEAGEESQRVAAGILDMFLAGAAALQSSHVVQEDVDTVLKILGLDGSVDGTSQAEISFWYRERVVRMLESVRACKAAAAAAVDAMQFAPTTRNYEVMRNVVFQRFLEVGDVEAALAAILYPPSPKQIDRSAVVADFWTEDEVETASSLRDMVGSLTNAVVERKMLRWLASCSLPESVSIVIRDSLQRLARSGDVITLLGCEKNPYEELMAWEMVRGDISSVAAHAFEWAQRLMREFVDGTTRMEVWTRDRVKALTMCLSAVKLLPETQQYVQSQPYRGVVTAATNEDSTMSLITGANVEAAMGDETFSDLLRDEISSPVSLLTVEDLERLVLLAKAQVVITARDGVDPSRPFDQSDLAVEFAVARLCSYQQLEPATRLALGWCRGLKTDKFAVQVARACGSVAAVLDKWDSLQRCLHMLSEDLSSSRNFALVALEGVMSTGRVVLSPPQWLIQEACRSGSANVVVAKLIQFGRLREAATTVSAALRSDEGGIEPGAVGYSAADYLLENLTRSDEDASKALRREILAHVEATS